MRTLEDLGFDSWFAARRSGLDNRAGAVARVTAVDRDRCLVRDERGEIRAEPTGRLRFAAESSADFPAVGDWACVQHHNDGTFAIIHELFPRRSVLRRKTPGKKVDRQLIAANIDRALIVQSCDANFSVRRMERYMVMIHEGGIEPLILLSKRDLVDDEELARMVAEIQKAGIHAPVIPFSNEEAADVEPVRALLGPGRTGCLLGSSGVGKTTLLNHLSGAAPLATSAVREWDGKGRHTTTRRQMVMIEGGGMVIDTPGMRELANIGAESGLDDSFSEIHELAAGCRFNDCTHTQEAGCAVLDALERGELDEGRYRNYIALVKESNYYRMSYTEKRKKDKKFGKMIKSVMKEKRKRKPE